jgi:hypothetical protein
MILGSREITAISLFLAMVVPLTGAAQGTAASKSETTGTESPVGDWRGESICQVRPSACHDEDSLYHVTSIADKPGWFSMKGDRIVDGKPVTMGTMDCQYDEHRHSLECVFPRGVLRFTVKGNTMEGTMSLPDKTLWRKITLKRVDS